MGGGSSPQAKGVRYEKEVVDWLTAHGLPATKISMMYQDGADIAAFNGRHIEARRRAANYESINQIIVELDGDASLYFTRLDGETDHVVVLYASTLLDLLDEADNGELWPE